MPEQEIIEEPIELTDNEKLIEAFQKSELDPSATESTLGTAYSNVGPEMLLNTSMRLLGMSQGKEQEDNKDSLEFQKIYGAHNYMAERIKLDPGNIIKNMLWKITNKGTLQNNIPTSVLDKHLRSTFTGSNLNQVIDGINPLEARDQSYKITRLGPGGISSLDSVPDEARNVQSSFLGYIDSIRSPESLKVGIDTYLAHNSRFGKDGNMYQHLYNPRTKQMEWVSAREASKLNIGFPESMTSKDKLVTVLNSKSGIKYVDKADVDYYVDHASKMFSSQTAAVVGYSGVKGMRTLMGSKMSMQALPLINKEAPLVGNLDFNKKSYSENMSKTLGYVKSDQVGKVLKVTKDAITVQQADGSIKEHELYNNFPMPRKTRLTSTPLVKVGDVVKKGQGLAKSNYTTDHGDIANGLNARVAYMTWKGGGSNEDGMIVSDAYAKRATSEHSYATKYRKPSDVEVNKSKLI